MHTMASLSSSGRLRKAFTSDPRFHRSTNRFVATRAKSTIAPLRSYSRLRKAFVCIIFICFALRNIIVHTTSILRDLQTELPPIPSYFATTKDYESDDFEIVTTNYGWTTDQSPRFSRRKLSGEFYSSVLAHPRYNSTAWGDLNKNPDPNRRVVAFMDIDTCIENNYPVYGPGFEHNLDISVEGEKWHSILDKSCKYIKWAAESPALTANKDSRLILLDCGVPPYHLLKNICGPLSTSHRNDGGWGNVLENDQVIIAYYGVDQKDARPIDIGLPPPAIKPINLWPHERHWIQECKSRNYLFSFQGRGGFKRERLLSLDNGKDVYVRIKSQESYLGSAGGGNITKGPESNPYGDIMRESAFAGAPRGDCFWSYRFAEIMSAGAIPVVYSNGWIPPFASSADPNRVVNWTKCALFVREGKEAEKTVDILRAIPDNVLCEMQKCSLAFWDEFASSRDGWLKGILSWVNNEHATES